MLFSFTPTVFAYDVGTNESGTATNDDKSISNVSIENATLNFNIGATPEFTGTVATKDADKYEILYELWELVDENGNTLAARYSDDRPLDDGINYIYSFEEGKTYKYSVMLNIKEGTNLTFSNNINFSLNDSVKANTSDSEFFIDKDYVFVSRIQTMTPETASKDISTNDINITKANIDAHVLNSPFYTAEISSDEYKLTDEFWVRDDGKYNYREILMDPQGKYYEDRNEYTMFEIDHSYTYGITLKAKYGYRFTNASRKIKINDTEIPNANFTVSEDGQTLTITNIKKVLFPAPSEDKLISTIKIKDVTFDFKPNDNPKFTGKVDDNLVLNEQWYGDDKFIYSNGFFNNNNLENKLDQFKEGISYNYCVNVSLSQEAFDNGYRFAKDVTLKVNDTVVTLPAEYINNDEYGYTFTNVKTITPTAASHVHNYDVKWKYDKDNHWHECECGEITDKSAHDMEIINQKEATTNAAGYTGDKVCKICGYTEKGNEIPPISDNTSQSSEGKNTSDPSGIPGLFTMITGLIGILTFKKRQNNKQ